MAMIIPPPMVTEVMEIYSNNKDCNEKEHFINKNESDISKDIAKCYDKEETHNQKDEMNVEETLRSVCDSIPSNGEKSCYNHRETENNISILANDSYLTDGIDFDKHSERQKPSELRVNDKYYNRDNSNNIAEKILPKRILNLVDSDSEGENILYKTNKESFTNNKCYSGSSKRLHTANHKNLKNKNARRVIDSESEDDTQTNNINDFSQIDTTIKSYQTLIDSESEEEKEKIAHNPLTTFGETDTSENKNTKKESIKKRKGSIRASKDEAMRQIHSETQRLLRETEISLPYHRPKQRTLQEFLSRKKISTALPKAPSTAAKLKMSSAIVSQVLAEKEKEAELFYKSSDSEDDTQQIFFVNKNIKNSYITNEKIFSTDIKHADVQDSQKIGTSNQDSHSKKEILQNNLNSDTSGVSVGKDFFELNHQDGELSLLIRNSNNQSDGSNILSQQVLNNKQSLQKIGIPRKLFDTCSKNKTNEVSDTTHEQETEKKMVEAIITSLNEGKYINDKKKPEISVTENRILSIPEEHQCDSRVTNEDRDTNLITERTNISTTPNNINDKEIAEMLQKNYYITNNVVTSVNSDDCITQHENNKRKNKCTETDDISSISISDTQSKIQDNSLTEKYEKSNHILGLPLPKFTDEPSTKRRKLLPELTQNSKVTLKGSPGTIIDLTDNAKPNGKGVNTLLDRFFCKHVINTKKQVRNKSEVTVIYLEDTQNGPLPVKEVLPYTIPINIDNSEFNKPGAKLMRLKKDLKLQMTLKRNKEWEQKEIELQTQEKEWNEEEESDCDLDGQGKADNSELSDSGESEPEENDVCIKDKKRSKCLFADDEAEVTDNEESNTSIEEIYNDSGIDQIKRNYKQFTSLKYGHVDNDKSEIETDQEEEKDKEDLDADIENGSESDFEDDDNVCRNINVVRNEKDRKMKQLIEESQNDSNITNLSYFENNSNQLKDITTDIDTPKTHCEDNGWISENESNMPAYQHAEVATRSQVCKTPSTKTSMLDFVSPITQLSVLNTTLDSNKKDSLENREYLVDEHESISLDSTQSDESSEHTYNIKNKTVLKKKLFDDVGETINDEYLMRLCSGKFESTQTTDLDLFSQSNTTESQLPESYLGNFNTKLNDIKQSKNPMENETSQNVKLTLNEDSNNSVNDSSEVKKVNTISPKLKLRIVSSDDEGEEDTFLKPKKRSAKRLNLSDSEEETVQFSDEGNDDTDNEEAGEQYVDYDSEENEVTVVSEKDIKKVAADFLEEEAELSESDWDSADEDERDLDKLEFEEADDEHIDERKVKDQLEKMHMKQILDEDKREVRLLKELLFEDGDLHTDGTGRERKFKWKNIDKLGNNIEMSQISDENDGWVDVQEDEEEAKWNKLKHERDKFLEERMKCSSNEIEDELCDSQIFKFGLEALRKVKDNESQNVSPNKIDPSENMEPIMPRNITDLLNGPNIGKKSQTIYNVIKKRSLLTRGEESLARIASLAKQGDPVSHTVNTRHFVFQYIDPCTDNTSKIENKVTEEEKDRNLQNKPQKRKMMSDVSLTMKKRRK